MKKSFLYVGIIALLLLLNNAAFGQQNDDAQKYLEPERGILAEYDLMYDYETEMRNLFNKGYHDDVVLRMVYLPSFDGFYLKFVGVKESDGKYSVLLLRAKKNKGHAQEPLEEYSAEIDKETAELLKSLWSGMILKAQYPRKPRLGHDGETYHFSVFVYMRGFVGGRIWSPGKNTNTGMLADIGGLLADYAKEYPGKRQEILKTIRSKAEELQGRLKE